MWPQYLFTSSPRFLGASRHLFCNAALCSRNSSMGIVCSFSSISFKNDSTRCSRYAGPRSLCTTIRTPV